MPLVLVVFLLQRSLPCRPLMPILRLRFDLNLVWNVVVSCDFESRSRTNRGSDICW